MIVSCTVDEYENKFKRVHKLRYKVKKSSYGKNSKTKTEEFFSSHFQIKRPKWNLAQGLMNASFTGLKTGTLLIKNLFLNGDRSTLIQ